MLSKRQLSVLVFVVVLSGSLFAILSMTATHSPGELVVTDLDPANTSVDENDTITMSATIENTGETEATEVITFSLGTIEQRVQVTVPPGETKTVDFYELRAGQLGIDTHTYDVVVDDAVRTATLTVTSDRPPQFNIVDLDPAAATLEPGEFVDLFATIENTGGMVSNQTVSLRVENQTITNDTLSIRPGETETFSVHSLRLGGLDPGERQYSVHTANDSAVADVTVSQPAILEISDATVSDRRLGPDDRFALTATVENTGEVAANRSVELITEESTIAAEHLTLAPGETTTIAFENISPDAFGLGTTRYWFSTGDDAVTDELTVEGTEPGRLEVHALDPETITTDEDTVDISATITNTGEQVATGEIRLYVAGTERVNTTVELPPGESESFDVFNVYMGNFAPGNYDFEVVTNDDRRTGTITLTTT